MTQALSSLVTGSSSKSFKSYNRFKQVQLNGSFTGYIEDFVAYGNFKTDLGIITTDINLKIADDPGNTPYSGKIKLADIPIMNNRSISEFKIEIASVYKKIQQLPSLKKTELRL